MGKFDKSRLSGLKQTSLLQSTPLTATASSSTTSTKTGDLRLKLLKKNQTGTDVRNLLNRKNQIKEQLKTKQELIKQTINRTINNPTKPEATLVKPSSILIFKSNSNDEKRLYKLVNDSQQKLNKNNHIVFANSEATLITLKNDQNIDRPALTVHKYNQHDDEDVNYDDDASKEEIEDYEGYKTQIQNREINLQIKRNFNDRPKNFKIQIDNSNKNRISSNEDIMDVDDEIVEAKQQPSVNTTSDVSPIQGYRLIISNLHPNVSEDDILELFSAIGPIKRAKFLNKGIADVVYVKLDDARNAISNYNNKLLDGRELKIELVTKVPISEKLTSVNKLSNISPALPQRVRQPTTTTIPITSQITTQNNTVNTLSKRFNTLTNEQQKLQTQTTAQLPVLKSNNNNNLANSKVTVDTSIIHQALFTNSKANINPVTFTVKI